jgi:curved DNA-binding protein CbpA
MSRLIDHYYEWDILGADSAMLKKRYQDLLTDWEKSARTALASQPDILENLPSGTLKNWPDEATLKRFALQEQSLAATSQALCAHYEPSLQELASVGERALRQGIQSSGRERDDEFNDALRILKSVLESPIGSRNYVAWFQVGWLQWKMGQLDACAESFYQAVRLSASDTNPSAKRYQVLSLLHLAHAASLQSRFTDAHQCLDRATQITPDAADVLVEQARLCLLESAPSNATDFLRPAMVADTSLMYGYFGDEDLSAHIPVVLVRLIQDNATSNRKESKQEIARYKATFQAINTVYERLNLPALPTEFAPGFLDSPEMQGVFGIATLRQQAQAKMDAMKTLCQETLQTEISKANALIDRLHKQLKRFEEDHNHWLREKERAELTAREGNFTLDNYSFKNPLTPRRNQFAEQIRQMHASSISHLKQAEEQVRIMKPDLEAKLDVQTSRIQKVEEEMAWLQLELEKHS